MSGGLVAERFRVTVLSAPLRTSVPMSFGSLTDRRLCLVEIDVGGLVGVGESWINYPAWAPRERLATLCEGVAPLVLNEDVSDPVRVQRRLTERLLPVARQWGAPGPVWQAISAVDLALWDLKGKRTGHSVAALLGASGGHRRRVPAYASGVGPTDVTSLCEAALRAGLTAVKAKVGFGPEQDEATLREARAVLGDRPALFADANQAWSLDEATEMSALLNRYGVLWLEEPLAGDDLEGLEKLAAESTIPLATGENLYGADTFDRYVRSSAVAVIQPDLTKSGGLTVGRHVAQTAARCSTAVAPHCYGGGVGILASLQLAAAFGSNRWVELDVRDNPLRTDLLASPPQLDTGALVVPEHHGLGVELDTRAVRHYRIHVEERTRHDL